MAFYTDTRISSGEPLLARALRNIRTHFADAREISRVRAELQSLSDRDLADLGIYRGDIDTIARSAVRIRT